MGGKSGKARCRLCQINRIRAGKEGLHTVRWTTLGCRICKVPLCKWCWHQWCHEGGGSAPRHIHPGRQPPGTPQPATPPSAKRRASTEARRERGAKRPRTTPPSPLAPIVSPVRFRMVTALAEARHKGMVAAKAAKATKKSRSAQATAARVAKGKRKTVKKPKKRKK